MKNIWKYSILATALCLFSCKQNSTVTEENTQAPTVSATHPVQGNISETQQLNGQVVYLNKTALTSPIAGYVVSVKTTIGKQVTSGDLLFEIQTKESAVLHQSNPMSGIVKIYATVSGVVSALPINEAGVYVSEGNDLATIIKNSDMVIQVNTPYEYYQQLVSQKTIEIELPNHQTTSAKLYKSMPFTDPASQTQQLYYKLNKAFILPENMNITALFCKAQHCQTLLLPKTAILTNETQNHFWVMKIVNDTMAIKIPVETGLEANDTVEIIHPNLQLSDKIIEKGAYGLPDRTRVKLNEQ